MLQLKNSSERVLRLLSRVYINNPMAETKYVTELRAAMSLMSGLTDYRISILSYDYAIGVSSGSIHADKPKLGLEVVTARYLDLSDEAKAYCILNTMWAAKHKSVKLELFDPLIYRTTNVRTMKRTLHIRWRKIPAKIRDTSRRIAYWFRQRLMDLKGVKNPYPLDKLASL